MLRFQIQINFTGFVYIYGVSFDVKRETSIPKIFNISVLNFRVQWSDEGSIVEP